MFQAIQLKPASMAGLVALAVIGIKQSDLSLVKASLNEMEGRLKVTNDDFFEDGVADHRADFMSVKALTLVLQGQKDEAR